DIASRAEQSGRSAEVAKGGPPVSNRRTGRALDALSRTQKKPTGDSRWARMSKVERRSERPAASVLAAKELRGVSRTGDLSLAVDLNLSVGTQSDVAPQDRFGEARCVIEVRHCDIGLAGAARLRELDKVHVR